MTLYINSKIIVYGQSLYQWLQQSFSSFLSYFSSMIADDRQKNEVEALYQQCYLHMRRLGVQDINSMPGLLADKLKNFINCCQQFQQRETLKFIDLSDAAFETPSFLSLFERTQLLEKIRQQAQVIEADCHDLQAAQNRTNLELSQVYEKTKLQGYAAA